tara:strand:- start:136 stop:417 length:282 start_codon:yes stop_codon:yes gene_type:complete
MRILILFLCLFLSGCASTFSAISTADVISTFITGKSSTDNVVSVVANKDCAVFRLFKGEAICIKTQIDVLMEMDCDIYSWDVQDRPYCRQQNN